MLCPRLAMRGPRTASLRSIGCQRRLHASPAPGSIWRASRANVKMRAITKLTAIEFERCSRTLSPSDTSESRKSSPTRRGSRYRHAVQATTPVWMPSGQSRGMKKLWFVHVARCVPEQDRTNHKRCCHLIPACRARSTRVAISVRCSRRSREVIPADVLTTCNPSTPFVIRTARRHFLPAEVTLGITVPAIGCQIERHAQWRCNRACLDRRHTESWPFMGEAVV